MYGGQDMETLDITGDIYVITGEKFQMLTEAYAEIWKKCLYLMRTKKEKEIENNLYKKQTSCMKNRDMAKLRR